MFEKRSRVLIAGTMLFVLVLLSAGALFLFLPFTLVLNAAVAAAVSVTLLLLSINYIYSLFRYDAAQQFYARIAALRGAPPKKIHSEEQLNAEIRRLLREWSEQSEQEIIHLKKVEEYRKEFLGNVSHELRTPIFTLQGYLHTLIDGGIDDKDINMFYLNKAAKSLERLETIVSDLESISRMESGDLQTEFRTFDIIDLVKEVIESLELIARDKNISIYISDAAPPKSYVFADKDLIRQVLVNLMVNSLKYGRKDGTTEIAVHEDRNSVSVAVKDDGIGIDKKHLPRIFERFYRVDKSRSREEGGTGLGLAIVKHILEAHNHEIFVESASGAGTTFTFTLNKSK